MEVKIKLKLKSVEVEMTPDEAKELIAVLQGIVGKEKEYIPYYPYIPPVYVPTVWTAPTSPYTVTWTTTAGTDDRTYTVSMT